MSTIVELVAEAIAAGALRAITIELPTPEAAAEQLALFKAQAIHPHTVYELAHGVVNGREWWQGGATVQAGPRTLSVIVTTPHLAVVTPEAA